MLVPFSIRIPFNDNAYWAPLDVVKIWYLYINSKCRTRLVVSICKKPKILGILHCNEEARNNHLKIEIYLQHLLAYRVHPRRFSNHKLVSSALHLSKLLLISFDSLERCRWKLLCIRCLSFFFLSRRTATLQTFVRALAEQTTTSTKRRRGSGKWRKKKSNRWMSCANLHWALVIYTITVIWVQTKETKHRLGNSLALWLRTSYLHTVKAREAEGMFTRPRQQLRNKENENVIKSWPHYTERRKKSSRGKIAKKSIWRTRTKWKKIYLESFSFVRFITQRQRSKTQVKTGSLRYLYSCMYSTYNTVCWFACVGSAEDANLPSWKIWSSFLYGGLKSNPFFHLLSLFQLNSHVSGKLEI